MAVLSLLLIPMLLLAWLLSAGWIGRRTSPYRLVEVGKALWIFSWPALGVFWLVLLIAHPLAREVGFARPSFLLIRPDLAAAGGGALLFLAAAASGYVILGDCARREGAMESSRNASGSQSGGRLEQDDS